MDYEPFTAEIEECNSASLDLKEMQKAFSRIYAAILLDFDYWEEDFEALVVKIVGQNQFSFGPLPYLLDGQFVNEENSFLVGIVKQKGGEGYSFTLPCNQETVNREDLVRELGEDSDDAFSLDHVVESCLTMAIGIW